MSARSFALHDEATAVVRAPVDRVFAYLDDPRSMSAHMGESSMMMMGSRMVIEIDERQGHTIGSKIRMRGSVFGIDLSLDEVITEREPPSRKTWETIGTPRLLVIDHYRMGFELTPEGDAARVRVFIDYSLPARAPGSWLGRLLGAVYARWCTKRMAEDAGKHFAGARAGTATTGGT